MSTDDTHRPHHPADSAADSAASNAADNAADSAASNAANPADAVPAGSAVDVHTHAVPRPLIEWLASHGMADLAGLGDGHVLIDPRVSGMPRGTLLHFPTTQFRADARLADMDRAGVSHHVVSLPPYVSCARADSPSLCREILQRGNDALCEFVGCAPNRLVALGSVPIGLYDAAEEARRCLDDLGMAGIVIGTQGAGRDLDDPVNDELFALLAQRRAFTLLHPSATPDPHRLREFGLPQLVGHPIETAVCVARMIFSGVLERHEMVLCLAHGGGALPILRGRLDTGWSRDDVSRSTLRPPGELLDRLYYDTAVFAPSALRVLLDDVGPGQLLLGTDTPSVLSDTDPLGTVAALGLDDAAAARIIAGNATELLKLP